MSIQFVHSAEQNNGNSTIFQHDSLLSIDSAQLIKLTKNGKSELTLLNFWATWCDPCVEEFPDLVTLTKTYETNDLRVLFVSADFERNLPSVRDFLVKQNFNFVSYYKKEKDNIFVNAMNPEWSGALPATFIYDKAGNMLDFWIGKKTLKELEAIINKHLMQ
jgi:thiol-disulfide isomerase/thioredoxin